MLSCMPRQRLHDKRLAEAVRKALKTPIARVPLAKDGGRLRLLVAFLIAELADEYPNFVAALRDAIERNL